MYNELPCIMQVGIINCYCLKIGYIQAGLVERYRVG